MVNDPAVMVSFPIKGDPDEASFIAWTTTPWTLPSNLALCVNAELTYVKVRVCGTVCQCGAHIC
jgi:isoleucyl-tRNA synthetase